MGFNIRVLPTVALGAALGTLLTPAIPRFQRGDIAGGFAAMGDSLKANAGLVIGFPLAVGLLSTFMRGVANPGIRFGKRVSVRLF